MTPQRDGTPPTAPAQKARRRLLCTSAVVVASALWLVPLRTASAEERNEEQGGDQQRQILILHSYYPTYEWTSAITRGIRDAFDPSAFADSRFLFEYLDAKRYPDHEYMRYVAQVLRVKYGGRSDIDLIISCDDQALQFLLNEARDLFPGVPVVFCGVNDYTPGVRSRGRPVTGVCEVVDINRNVALIPELCPWVRRVLVVTDPHTRTSLALRGRLAAAFRLRTPDLEVRFTGDVTPEELAARVSGLGRDTVVFLLLFSRDENGRDYTHEEAISLLAATCPVPVFGFWDTYLGLGIVGGLLTSPEIEGRRAGELALRVLNGESAADIAVVNQPANRYMFDWRQLRRFGIDEGRLPPGSLIINREPSFMARYWGWIVLAVSVILFESMLIAALLIQRANLRQAQTTLQESESILRHVLDLVPHYIHARDGSGRFLLANQAVADAVGRPLRDVIGHAYAEFSPDPDEAEDALADDAELMRSGETHLSLEERFTDASGDVHWLTTFKRPFEWRGCQAVLVCSMDITEKRELEDQLRQSQKMEAVGRLAGGVAHDFNNLLQVIRGYAPLLKRDYAHDESAVHKFDQIIRASDRAMVLVRQLLTFSRRETMHPEPVDPVALTTQLTKMIKRLLGEHIEIVLNVHNTPPPVYADPGQLEQVLMNLCVNSRDAMPGGGRIVIDVASRSLDATWCRTHPDVMPGEYVCLSVSDTGCGMSPDLCERVFEPFFTTKAEGKGTGLGLATVYAIVRRHGGHIDVYSQEGLGTTFRVFVPVAPSACLAAEADAEGPDDLPGGTETILLAEDGDLVREMTQSILEEAGYSVITACDGEEAVVLFAENSSEIDLLVLDVIMPKRNGRDVYEAVSSRRKGIPVLFVSGYSSDLLESDYLLSVPGDILQKPYTEPELLERIRTLLDRS
jgi:PAS domain S-box-containing protein